MHQERPRHGVPAVVIAVLRPMFRFSYTRDAYVLRFVGNRRGPVLRVKVRQQPRRAAVGAGSPPQQPQRPDASV